MNVTPPMGWQVIGLFLGLSVAGALAYVSTTSYAQVENVSGAIVPDRGIAAVIPTRPGIVSRVFVHEGDPVRKDRALAVIPSDDYLTNGQPASERLHELFGGGAQSEAVKTSMLAQIPAGRVGSGDDVAQAAMFLPSDVASYINGAELFVDGGMAQI